MRGHAGKLGEDGVEEGRGVLGDIRGYSLQQEQHALHRLTTTGGTAELKQLYERIHVSF